MRSRRENVVQQPTLLGAEHDVQAAELHNLFFALWPDDATRQRIAATAAELKQRHQPQGRWIKPHRYHLTLKFLGEYAPLPPSLIEQASVAASKVRSDTFVLNLDQAGSFANRAIPWWLGCSRPADGLDRLSSELHDALCRAGIRMLSSHLIPHVTVLRDGIASLVTTPIPAIQWSVDEFVLIDSLLGARAEYRVVAKFVLHADR
ncbi:MAG TPA: RNA 2',3'-cyclic phosphodiesterase [Rudaea sp.]|jgi:2'-5' RNA ligase|uniref:RNA 2',3'-cyclic phosphodiesterase n=1 Tax=Rudaea sp. TaxID=2136325 RepID=UPI002F936684